MSKEELKHKLHTSIVDLERLRYIYGEKETQEDIYKLEGRIELIQELLSEEDKDGE